jgi:antitoxin component of MazEF toxin-antitoxin module
MAAIVKVQKVERPTNRSFYVNIPTSLADAIGLQKGEQFAWSLEDKNTLVFVRVKRTQPRVLRSSKR